MGKVKSARDKKKKKRTKKKTQNIKDDEESSKQGANKKQKANASEQEGVQQSNKKLHPGFIIEDLITGDLDSPEACSGAMVSVRFSGKVSNKERPFISNIEKERTPIKILLGAQQVIAGLDEGIIGMRVGGKRKLTIPPEMGYGSSGAGIDVPGNSELTYEVELVAIEVCLNW